MVAGAGAAAAVEVAVGVVDVLREAAGGEVVVADFRFADGAFFPLLGVIPLPPALLAVFAAVGVAFELVVEAADDKACFLAEISCLKLAIAGTVAGVGRDCWTAGLL